MSSLSPLLLERVRQEMRIRHYSRHTIRAYGSYLRAFVQWFKPRAPREAGPEAIKAFLLHLHDGGASRSALDQAISALRFLYVELYGRMSPGAITAMRPRRESRLPRVLSRGGKGRKDRTTLLSPTQHEEFVWLTSGRHARELLIASPP